MPAINRYILIELMKVFVLALLAMTAVLLLSDVTKELQNQGLGIVQVHDGAAVPAPLCHSDGHAGSAAICRLHGLRTHGGHERDRGGQVDGHLAHEAGLADRLVGGRSDEPDLRVPG